MATPAAIVIAGAMIAAGLFFGLRGGAAPTAPPAPVAPSPPTPTPAAPAVAHEVVARQASEALAYQRDLLRARCHRGPPQAPGSWLVNLTFDAEGRQIARGWQAQAETTTPELTRCVGDALPPLFVPPPGRTVRVDIPLALP
ncbi:MAG: hypothetical protein JNL82_36255 [Myxococcales bacterium]|nr:hypothetical protein [Myxococcales bacterium]